MTKDTHVMLSIQEWSDYLKSQIDSWPEWKKATSSYSYVPVSICKRKEDSSEKPLPLVHYV